jgi:CDP-diacylglycerol--glycerol-3-phosphate 3-phosphatidyltransferase
MAEPIQSDPRPCNAHPTPLRPQGGGQGYAPPSITSQRGGPGIRTTHDWLRRQGQVVLNPIARVVGRTGLTPNMLTVIGLALNAGVAVVLARGGIALGGWLLLVASSFDALDGTLARLTGRQSRFGAFLDSTLDRYSEVVVYGGLLFYYLDRGARTETLLVYVAIGGSLMVSYARARAEGLGVDCKVGLATRMERMLVVAAGLILGRVTLVLWLVAIFANLTAVQRIACVWRVTRREL